MTVRRQTPYRGVLTPHRARVEDVAPVVIENARSSCKNSAVRRLTPYREVIVGGDPR